MRNQFNSGYSGHVTEGGGWAWEYTYTWKNNEKRETLYGRKCNVLKRWRNSRLVEFENGQQEVVSGNALRRRKDLWK